MRTAAQWLVCVIATIIAPACTQKETPKPVETASGDYVLERVKMPGFSMNMPKGEVVLTSKSPSSGTHRIKPPQATLFDHFSSDAVVYNQFVVSWTTKTTTPEKWGEDSLPFFILGMESALPGAKVLHQETVAEDRWFAVAGTERAPVSIGAVRCDPKFQIDITFSRWHDPVRQAEMAREILQSVRCEVTDENRAGLIAATRLPDGFGWIANDSAQHFQSLSGETLIITFSAGNIISTERKVHRAVIHALFKTIDPALEEPAIETLGNAERESRREVTMNKARLPAEGETVYVGTKFCPNEASSLVLFWNAPEVNDELAWTRLSQVDCPGAPSTPSPPFADVTAAACSGGDKVACKLNAELAQ